MKMLYPNKSFFIWGMKSIDPAEYNALPNVNKKVVVLA